MKIGLVGEAPNDTIALENLLIRHYKNQNFDFFPLLDRIRGSQLDSKKTLEMLRKEFYSKNPNVVIFIRDLDDDSKKEERFKYFKNSNSIVLEKGIYLLNIYEIEALVLADIQTFNKFYKVNVSFNEIPTTIKNPKERLKTLSTKFSVTDLADIFKIIDIKKLNKCSYFETFINELDLKVLEI